MRVTMKVKTKTRMRVAEAGEDDDVERRLESDVRWMALASRAQSLLGRVDLQSTKIATHASQRRKITGSSSRSRSTSRSASCSCSCALSLLLRLGLSSESIRMAMAERKHASSSQLTTMNFFLRASLVLNHIKTERMWCMGEMKCADRAAHLASKLILAGEEDRRNRWAAWLAAAFSLVVAKLAREEAAMMLFSAVHWSNCRS